MIMLINHMLLCSSTYAFRGIDSLLFCSFTSPPPLQSFPNESSIQQKVLGLLVSELLH